MANLTELANKFDSDKGTTGGRNPHRYTYLYDLLFFPYKDQKISFLEIGLCRGGPELGRPIEREATSPSVEMWKAYFSEAQITGFDISDFSHQEDARFKFVRGDAGNDEDMVRLANARSHYDVILDDASHASYHQQNAIKHLWDKLRPGGLFIVEDLNWQPPVYEEKLPKVTVTAELFRKFFEEGEYLDSIVLDRAFMERLKAESDAVSFFPNFKPFSSSKIKLMVVRKRGPAGA